MKEDHDPESRKSKRSILVYLFTIGNITLFFNRINISVAVIYMFSANVDRGLVLCGFFPGYMTGLILMARLAQIYGSRKVFILCTIGWSFSTLITVWLNNNLYLVVLSRVSYGLFSGCNYPCQQIIYGNWLPDDERSSSWGFSGSGESIGTVLSLLFCPILVHKYGWESVFYVSAAMAWLFLILFWYLISESPETHPTITMDELQYITINRCSYDGTLNKHSKNTIGGDFYEYTF
eukprot:UN23746